MNAKSGECYQDCKYCAQSIHHNSTVETYPLTSKEKILSAAETTYKSGVKFFGIVTSGHGFSKIDDDFQNILDAIDLIKEKLPDMQVCASLGILSETTVKALAAKNILHYNINLQVNQDNYQKLIATTHTIKERVNTIKLLKEAGIKVCCGGIIGLGETILERIEMAYELKTLAIDVIPLNVLIPIKGTPLENAKTPSVAEIIKTFALFRLIHPDKIIKFAAGRETVMKDYQSLVMLSGANGLLTGGYLTTRGRTVSEDDYFLKQLNFFS